jgi:hypothetical protein
MAILKIVVARSVHIDGAAWLGQPANLQRFKKVVIELIENCRYFTRYMLESLTDLCDKN